MSDKALSRITFWLLLLVHCVAGGVLFVTLVGFVPKLAVLFDRLDVLPPLTVFVMLLSGCWYWLLLIGTALDVAVLYVLSRLPKRLRWLSIAWFGLVLAAIVVLHVLVILGLRAHCVGNVCDNVTRCKTAAVGLLAWSASVGPARPRLATETVGRLVGCRCPNKGPKSQNAMGGSARWSGRGQNCVPQLISAEVFDLQREAMV